MAESVDRGALKIDPSAPSRSVISRRMNVLANLVTIRVWAFVMWYGDSREGKTFG